MTKSSEGTLNYVAYSAVGSEQEKEERLGPVPKIGVRHFQILLLFFLLLIAYGFRVVMSVAIVAMTDPTASPNPNVLTFPSWTQKGAILSAFFWGYIWPQVFAGYASTRYGAKWFLMGTMGVQSVLGLCTPFTAAYLGEKGVMASRAVEGFCQGFVFPSIATLLSRWVPAEERARMSNFVFGAVPCGTVISMLVSGMISSTWYGWPMVFYLYGSLGLAVIVLFSFLGHNSPAVHPTISKAERYYIEKSLGQADKKISHKVPWKAIATSRPVMALLVAQCGAVYGFWTLLSQIPSYMKHVLNFDMKQNSILSSLPYLVSFLLSQVTSFASDYVINKGFLSRTVSRKVFNSTGTILPSVALIMMGYVGSDEGTKAVWLLILAVGLSAFVSSGFSLNHMDLSPNYAGTLMGICNGISNILAVVAPLSVQFLVRDQTDPAQWRIIFFLAAAVQTVTALVFDIFGTAKVQPWNDKSDHEDFKE